MDRSVKSKLAMRAAVEVLQGPKVRPVLKLQAAKLILEFEIRQAELAEQRAARRHEKANQSTEVTRLRQENAGLREQLQGDMKPNVEALTSARHFLDGLK